MSRLPFAFVFEHIRSRIRIPNVIRIPFLIGGFVLLYLVVRDDKAKEAAAVASAQQHDAAEDLELQATMRARFGSLAAIAIGPEIPCRESLEALPVVHQAWIAELAATTRTAVVAAPLVQTLAFEQLARGTALAPEERGRRNRRLQELAIAPRVALLIVSDATRIVESPGEPGKSKFSAATLDGQLAIVDVPAGELVCRAALHVLTPAFTGYAATESSADNTRVMEDAWREPIWKEINAVLGRVGGVRATSLRD